MESLPSNDRGIFTEPLPSNDKGILQSRCPATIRGIHREREREREKCDLISLLYFFKIGE
jgi:hypothetical protein